MRKFSTKSLVAIIGGTAVAVAAAGAAYAYWTTTGTGSGIAKAGTSSAVTLSGVADSTLLTPGGPASVVTVSVTNPSTGFQKITTVHLASVVAYPTDADRTAETNAIAGCGTADFAMPDIAANQNVPPTVTTALTATGSLTMNNLGTSQDACKSAFLKLNLTSS
jgi:hypothetical protein